MKKKDNKSFFPVPFWSGVIVERTKLPIEDKILLPYSAKSMHNEGIVKSIGSDLKKKIDIGDKVLFNRLANQYIIYQDKEYLIMHEDAVFGRIAAGREMIEDTLEPFGTTVFVEKKQEEQITVGGIVLPDVAPKTFTNVGFVINAGPECRIDIKRGDKVVSSAWADQNFIFRNSLVFMMNDVDILAVLPHDSFSGSADLGREPRRNMNWNELPEIEKPEPMKGSKTYEIKRKSEI